ncbi:hypothetical protein L249_2600 [Ophiocordyceps polyrhachis-furcata BCC 54312]|uniref:Uncharacterized protein n=1 Tax=Ophiocordyceps polyrhachis-furcata BCC 54312 TaxID=1330021 RepID=A0A367LPM4_9HYPO|nr:hypothetical protein L249_2600 [Ophiocordyceps polyrhachis-furcata BCC 54312]
MSIHSLSLYVGRGRERGRERERQRERQRETERDRETENQPDDWKGSYSLNRERGAGDVSVLIEVSLSCMVLSLSFFLYHYPEEWTDETGPFHGKTTTTNITREYINNQVGEGNV